MARQLLWIWLLGLVLPAAASAQGPPRGDYYTRLRANDAPIAGRFTIYAYMLDSLDAAVALPGPGRVLAVSFRDANGSNSFIVPGDLAILDDSGNRWQGGFLPLSDPPPAGFLDKDQSRWALWFVPSGTDTLRWSSARDLKLDYGLSKESFVPLKESDAAATLRALPWDRIRAADLGEAAATGKAVPAVDPAAFDAPPRIKTRKDPTYPREAKRWDFEGTVAVVAQVDAGGGVTDAYVLQSNAAHDLNVAALVAVSQWTFVPGTKRGRPAAGGVVVPVQFSLGTVK